MEWSGDSENDHIWGGYICSILFSICRQVMQIISNSHFHSFCNLFIKFSSKWNVKWSWKDIWYSQTSSMASISSDSSIYFSTRICQLIFDKNNWIGLYFSLWWVFFARIEGTLWLKGSMNYNHCLKREYLTS